MKTENILSYLFSIGLLLINSSCENFSSLTPEEKLIGIWETDDQLGTYTFNANHTYNIDDLSIKEHGNWFIKDNALFVEPEGKESLFKDEIIALEKDLLIRSYSGKSGKTVTVYLNRKERFKDEIVAQASAKFNSEEISKFLSGNWKYNNTYNEVLTFNDKNEYRSYAAGKDLVVGKWFVYNNCIYLQPLNTPSSLVKDKIISISSDALTVSYILNGERITDEYTKDDHFIEPLPMDHKTDFELANDIGRYE
jgi:hypothetical protein